MPPLFNVLFTIPQRPAMYLDPGSGSVILQLLIASLLGLGILIRTYWKKIKAWLSGKKNDDNESDD